jgi:uncharacterized protein (DUF433 family)
MACTTKQELGICIDLGPLRYYVNNLLECWVSAIVDNFDYGVSAAEIADQFEVAQDSVEMILTYADRHLPTTNNQ